MSEDMSSGNGEGLITFLEWAGGRGVMNPQTANSYRVASTRILEVEANPASVDIAALDVEDLLDRFARLRGSNYTPDSMSTYKSRFRKAVELYLIYLSDPGDFKAPRTVTSRRRRKRPTDEKLSTSVPESQANRSGSSPSVSTSVAPATATELVQYPFPLRAGGTAYLHLPRQLPGSEVDRLVGFLKSLVFDQPESGAGDG